MELSRIFLKPVTRPIEGVIKADDESSLLTELHEYVLTGEITRQLEQFLDAYNDYQGANGVWISGFYGSGKSHLLKMLALLLEDRQVEGESALGIFVDKIPPEESFLRANLQKAVSIPSQSVLFNIDQKADVISKTQTDALLSVFVKVFDEMCGYYGKQPYIAQFERDLDQRGQLEAFRDAYEDVAGKPWERGREQVLLEGMNVARAYAHVTGEDAEQHRGLLNHYRDTHTVSIEDFSNQVRAWLDAKPEGFRLNFFVDEVGQFIADNTKLMTNLQTVAESLNTRCRGQAWIIVTAQEDMNAVLGDMNRQQSNDFSKIQARFANRLKLSSADVAEVIQKRLLTKNKAGTELLQKTYAQQMNNFRTLFEFTEGTQQYRNYRDEDHFVYSYPFVPYQFPLFQAAIRGISDHNGFEGRASSVGERSMLGVFRDVAIAIQEAPVGDLATFDRMFEGIRGSLKASVMSAINVAEQNLDDEFAVRVLKALFLVKYVREFQATLRNLTVLMTERFSQDITALSEQLAAALDLLERQTYIQRNGDVFEYLTDEEQDVEEAIKSTEVETAELQKELEKLLFDGVIGQRRLRSRHGTDHAFTRMLDNRILGRETEMKINVITPLAEDFDELITQRMQTMGRDELRAVLPADPRFMQDLSMYKRTERYIRQNSGTQQESRRRIIDTKGHQNSERYRELQLRTAELLGEAVLIINAHDLEISGDNGATRIQRAFEQLVDATYPNLGTLRGRQYSEGEIADILKRRGDGLFAGEVDNMTEPEQEVLAAVTQGVAAGRRSTVKSLVEQFEKKPYGWPYAAVLCNLASLYMRGTVTVRQDGVSLDESNLERALRNTQAQGSLIVEPQVQYSASQLRNLKDFHNEFFGRPPAENEARGLTAETAESFRKMSETYSGYSGLQDRYPFLSQLKDVTAKLTEYAGMNEDWYLTKLPQMEDDLFDLHENLLQPVRHFMEGQQRQIYDRVRALLTEERDNLPYIPDIDRAPLEELLTADRPWEGNRLQQLRPQLDAIQQAVNNQVAGELDKARQRLQELRERVSAAPEFDSLAENERQQLLQPFTAFANELQQHSRIAMIRDQLRQFENERYPAVLQELTRLLQPAPPTSEQSERPGEQQTGQDPQPAQQPEIPTVLVSARTISVPFSAPWIESAEQLDEYLQLQREAWLREIEAGRRVQL